MMFGSASLGPWIILHHRRERPIWPDRWATFVEPLDDAVRLPWCDWLRRHGIDPRGVPIPTSVCCWDQARVITVARLEIVAPDASQLYVRQEIQLEAPALPFPSESHVPDPTCSWLPVRRMMSGDGVDHGTD